MEEKRQRDEEARDLLEKQAAGKAQWAVMMKEKLEQDAREARTSPACIGCLLSV